MFHVVRVSKRGELSSFEVNHVTDTTRRTSTGHAALTTCAASRPDPGWLLTGGGERNLGRGGCSQAPFACGVMIEEAGMREEK